MSQADTRTYYNLLDEPWIRCVMVDGTVNEYGLLQLNNHINEIKDIVVPDITGNYSPLHELALHRFLFLIYNRAFYKNEISYIPLEHDFTKEECQIVENYLLEYRDRFYIEHPKTPFMQTPVSVSYDLVCKKVDAGVLSAKKRNQFNACQKQMAKFVASIPGIPSPNAIESNNMIGYSRLDSEMHIEYFKKNNIQFANGKPKPSDLIGSFAECYKMTHREVAYHLLYLNSFALCPGGEACDGIASKPSFFGLIYGDTLAKTIHYNLWDFEDLENQPELAGAPMWEHEIYWETNPNIPRTYSATFIYQINRQYTFFPSRLCVFLFDDDNKSNRLIYTTLNHKEELKGDDGKCGYTDLYLTGLHDMNAIMQWSSEDGWYPTPYEDKQEFQNFMTLLSCLCLQDASDPSATPVNFFPQLQTYKNKASCENVTPCAKIRFYVRSFEPSKKTIKTTYRFDDTNITQFLNISANSTQYVKKYINTMSQKTTGLFALIDKCVEQYYKLLHNGNKVQKKDINLLANSIKQSLADFAINDGLKNLYKTINSQQNVKESVEKLQRQLYAKTRSIIFEKCNENILCASKAYVDSFQSKQKEVQGI